MLRRGPSLAACHALLFIHTSSPLRAYDAPQDTAPGVVRNLQIPDVAARLASIEKEIEAQRKEENIPGVALVIVAGDKIIYVNGLGLRNIEQGLPVTPDTLFEESSGPTSSTFVDSNTN